MENLENNLFYNLEKAIKTYRNLAQKRLIGEGFNMTIDQWLALKALQQNPSLSQLEICKIIFKDPASMHEIIDEMIAENYVTKKIDFFDPRIINLEITIRGEEAMKSVHELVIKNRTKALQEISFDEIQKTIEILKKIIHNCQNQ